MSRKLLLLALLQFILVGCGHVQPILKRDDTKIDTQNIQAKKVVLVVLENTKQEDIFGNNTPFLKSLAKNGVFLSNYHGVAHPSQPNYIALVSGSVKDNGGKDITDSIIKPKLTREHLGKQLNTSHIEWMTYAEDYKESSCDSDNGAYVTKHVPFVSFDDVQDFCSKHITGSFSDFKNASKLPSFSLVIPNLDNDAHGSKLFDGFFDDPNRHIELLRKADKWLQEKFGTLIDDHEFKRDALLIVTFDENHTRPLQYSSDNDNKVFAALYGDAVDTAACKELDDKLNACKKPYNHYDLLHTIEDILHLQRLPADDKVDRSIVGIWKK